MTRLCLPLVSTLLLLFLYSCKEPRQRDTIDKSVRLLDGFIYEEPKNVTANEIPSTEASSGDSVAERRESEQINLGQQKDSMRAIRVLRKHLKDLHYESDFQLKSDFFSTPTAIHIETGFLFSTDYRHAVVRRTFEYGTNIDVFLITDSSMTCVISEDWDWFSFKSDTIADINGDSLTDFVVNWYPASGCCLRDVYDVFVFRQRNGTFCPKLDFVNPHFVPSEKLIHGMNYGHFPGRYTYRWTGNRVDTVEVYEQYPQDGTPLQYWILHRPGRKPVHVKKLPAKYDGWSNWL